MKIDAFSNEMLNLQKCISHGNQVTTICSGFKYYEFDCPSIIKEDCLSKNIILFFLEGHFTVSCNQFTDRSFGEYEMILLPKSSAAKICGETNSRLMLMLFDVPEESHDKHEVQFLTEAKRTFNYHFVPSPLRYPLTSFAETVAHCLQSGMATNAQFHALMHRQFFLLFKNFYTKKEAVGLFYPIIGIEPDFRDFIMQNYLKVNNVEELILLSNLGRSSFYSKFKEVFGMTAKQWMQKQICERIHGKAIEPGICVKQLMETGGFDSHTHFYRYFKQHFGCTPRVFINRCQGIE